MTKISIALTLLFVLCAVTGGLAAQKPGILPRAEEAQRPAEQETIFDDSLGRSTYQEIRIPVVDSHLPEFLVNTLVLGFHLWRWLSILIVIPLVAVLILIASLLMVFMPRTAKAQGEPLIRRLTGPLRTLIYGLALWVISFFFHSVLMSNF
jgi:hypothetical protein